MERDWVTLTIKAGGWIVAALAALFMLGMLAALLLRRWPEVGVMFLWTAGAAVVSAMLFGYARKVAR